MNKQEQGGAMSRRTAIGLMAVIGGAGIGVAATGVRKAMDFLGSREKHYFDPNFKIDMDYKMELDFDEAAQLAIRFDKAFDKLPEPKIEYNDRVLAGLAYELIPQFQYEGVTPETEWPKDVKFIIFSDGDSANHVLGSSYCSNYAIVNGRMELPLSTFAKTDAAFTLAHELAHVAQTRAVCDAVVSEEIESSAQIGALEVTAGLALQGNPLWLWATIDELRGMAVSSAYGLALKENRFNEFHQLRGRLSPGATSEAKFQKSRRRWASDPAQLGDILYKYNVKPMNRLIYAVSHKDAQIDDLAFPPIHSERPFGGSFTVWTLEKRPVKLDDLAYLIQNVEPLVSDLVKNEKRHQ